MRGPALAAVALLCLGAAAGAVAGAEAGAAGGRGAARYEARRPRREPRAPRPPSRRAPYAAEYDDTERNEPAPPAPPAPQPQSPAWPWQPIAVNIPIPRGAGSQVPLVILPLPMPVPMPVAAPAPQPECKVQQEPKYNEGLSEDYYASKPYQTQNEAPRRPPARQPRPPPPPPPRQPPAQQYPSYVNPLELDQPVTSPHIETPFTSEQLVRLFREQGPAAPSLPPVLLSEHDRSERVPAASAAAAPAAEPAEPAHAAAPAHARAALPAQPAQPRVARSVVVAGELTVPRADYTETYTAWYDAESGSARVEFFGGSAASYRTITPDGNVQLLEMRVDRSGERAVRRCGRAGPERAAPPDRHPPAFPDFSLFSFAGYVRGADNVSLERWQHAAADGAGGAGGAGGEQLTAHHDLLVARDAAAHALPLQYVVSVDSSVLGPDCDGYQHRYLDVRPSHKDAAFFTPNIEELCDTVEALDRARGEHAARLEPLREFVAPRRDPRHHAALRRFKSEHNRQYADEAEEAVRKNVLMQSSRFTAAGNRQGATFAMEVNFLGERLDAELQLLMGVEEGAGDRAERFPHSRRQLRDMEPRLPDRFDWRPRGGVSPVQFQGATCASCWAFAVSGAVEGALFARARRLVPLSPQCLVDCAHPYGGKGCKGTWPSHAYTYVQERGLPALDEYTPYQEKVQQCRESSVPAVTRISSHVNVTANSVPALKVAIKQHAPSVVLVDGNAKSFVFYKKGVLYDDRCGKTLKKLKHAVLAVGWGTSKGEPHFVLKNSWSAAWGERGFVRVQARANTCGVLTRPSYPRLAAPDILRRDLAAAAAAAAPAA